MNVRHIESSTKSTTLHLKKVDENFVTDLKAKLEKAGGCVAIICNTVKRSQDLYEQLSRDGFFTDKIELPIHVSATATAKNVKKESCKDSGNQTKTAKACIVRNLQF